MSLVFRFVHNSSKKNQVSIQLSIFLKQIIIIMSNTFFTTILLLSNLKHTHFTSLRITVCDASLIFQWHHSHGRQFHYDCGNCNGYHLVTYTHSESVNSLFRNTPQQCIWNNLGRGTAYKSVGQNIESQASLISWLTLITVPQYAMILR